MIGKLAKSLASGAKHYPLLDASLILIGTATVVGAVVSVMKPKTSTSQTAAVPKAGG